MHVLIKSFFQNVVTWTVMPILAHSSWYLSNQWGTAWYSWFQ